MPAQRPVAAAKVWRLSATSVSVNEHPQCGKICLPHDLVSEIYSSDINESTSDALIFEVSNPRQRLLKYRVGVLDFSCKKGECRIPAHILSHLRLAPSSSPVAEQCSKFPLCLTLLRGESRPPQALFLKLRPQNALLFQRAFVDPRSALESVIIRHYTVLSEGDTVVMESPVLQQEGISEVYVDVVTASPNGSVCVINADVEVDIDLIQTHASADPIHSIYRFQSNGASIAASNSLVTTRQRLVVGASPLSFSLPENSRQYFSIELDQVDCSAINSLDIVVTGSDPMDADVYVDSGVSQPGPSCYLYHNVLHPDQCRVREDRRQWEKRTLVVLSSLELVNPATEQRFSTVSVSVWADAKEACNLKISIIAVADDQILIPPSNTTTSVLTSGSSECPHCLHSVDALLLQQHVRMCTRFMIVCSSCQSVYRKDNPHFHCPFYGLGQESLSLNCDDSSIEYSPCCDATFPSNEALLKHRNKMHDSMYSCPYQCNNPETTMLAMQRHRRQHCPKRLILCRYCHTLVPHGGPATDLRDRLSNRGQHESQCGSSTEPCYKCGKYISRKLMIDHIRHHDFTITDTTPLPVTNAVLYVPINDIVVSNSSNIALPNFGVNTVVMCHNSSCRRLASGYMRQQDKSTWSLSSYLCTSCITLCLGEHGPLLNHASIKDLIRRYFILSSSKGCGNENCLNELLCCSSKVYRASSLMAEQCYFTPQQRLDYCLSLSLSLSSSSPKIYLCLDAMDSDGLVDCQLVTALLDFGFSLPTCCYAVSKIRSNNVSVAVIADVIQQCTLWCLDHS